MRDCYILPISYDATKEKPEDRLNIDFSKKPELKTIFLTSSTKGNERIYSKRYFIDSFKYEFEEEIYVHGFPKHLKMPKGWKKTVSRDVADLIIVKDKDIKSNLCIIADDIYENPNVNSEIINGLQMYLRNNNIHRNDLLIVDISQGQLLNTNMNNLLRNSIKNAVGVVLQHNKVAIKAIEVFSYIDGHVITEQQYLKLKTFIGTPSENLLFPIMNSCNLEKSIIYYLLLLNNLNLTKKDNLKQSLEILELLSISPTIEEINTTIVATRKKQITQKELEFIAENYVIHTASLRSTNFNLKYKLKNK